MHSVAPRRVEVEGVECEPSTPRVPKELCSHGVGVVGCFDPTVTEGTAERVLAR